MTLDAKIPKGILSDKWTDYKSSIPLVSPANKKKLKPINIKRKKMKKVKNKNNHI